MRERGREKEADFANAKILVFGSSLRDSLGSESVGDA
jgi:hypothetical protein